MSGVLKNNGLVRISSTVEKKQQTSLFKYNDFDKNANSSNKFEEVSFTKANTGGLMRFNDNLPSVEIPVTSNNKNNNELISPNVKLNNVPNRDFRNELRPVLIAGKKGTLSDGKKNGELDNNAGQNANTDSLLNREEIMAECEQIKLAMINEGEQTINEAKAWADEYKNKAQKDIKKLYDDAETEIEEIKRKTEEDSYNKGYELGFNEGSEKGYNEGYNKGLRKCKDTLKELMSMMNEIPLLKDAVFKKYEHELFDSIFTIANKITIDSLKQKDKNVIQKMLRQAAKSFRNSEFIKVSLSKLDIEEMGNAELDCLRGIFRESQHVEFEIVKDAPKGTLILDNGSEITDAGILTQLMMIENLGKGKFRDKTKNDDR